MAFQFGEGINHLFNSIYYKHIEHLGPWKEGLQSEGQPWESMHLLLGENGHQGDEICWNGTKVTTYLDFLEGCQNKDKKFKKTNRWERTGYRWLQIFSIWVEPVLKHLGTKIRNRIEEFYFHWLFHSRIGVDPSSSLCSLISKVKVRVTSLSNHLVLGPGCLSEQTKCSLLNHVQILKGPQPRWPSFIILEQCDFTWP